MSLRDAVSEIADQMEKELVELLENVGDKYPVKMYVNAYIKQLRTAVKASPEQTPAFVNSILDTYDGMLGSGVDPELIKKAQDRLKQKIAQVSQADSKAPQMVEVCGGQVDGNMVTIESGMPQGSYAQLGSEVYHRKGNSLVFDQAETLKLRNQK